MHQYCFITIEKPGCHCNQACYQSVASNLKEAAKQAINAIHPKGADAFVLVDASLQAKVPENTIPY